MEDPRLDTKAPVLSTILGCLFVHGNGHSLWKKVAVVAVLHLQFNSQLAPMNKFAKTTAGFSFLSQYHIFVLYLMVSTALRWKLVNTFSYTGMVHTYRNYGYHEKNKLNRLFWVIE